MHGLRCVRSAPERGARERGSAIPRQGLASTTNLAHAGPPSWCCLGGWMAGHRWEELLPTGRDVSQRRSAQRNPEITSRGRERMLQLTCPRWRGPREHGGVPGTDLRPRDGSPRFAPCPVRLSTATPADRGGIRGPDSEDRRRRFVQRSPRSLRVGVVRCLPMGQWTPGADPALPALSPRARPPSDVRAARARSAGPPLSADNDQTPEARGRRLGMEPQRVSWHHSWC